MIEYKRIGNGYEINLLDLSEKDKNKYPNDFWKGLGVVKSNLR